MFVCSTVHVFRLKHGIYFFQLHKNKKIISRMSVIDILYVMDVGSNV
jgi:hypothetical protein